MSTVGIPHYADGLALALGDRLGDVDRDAEALGLSDGETETEAEALGDELGEAECDGLADWLTVVIVGVCHNPSASTIRIPPARISAIDPLP